MASRITTRSRHSKTATSTAMAYRNAGPQREQEKLKTSPGPYLNIAPSKQETLKNRGTNPRPKIRETGETSRENKTKRAPPKQPDSQALLALAIGRLKARVVPKKRAEAAPARPNRSKARKSQPNQNRRPAPASNRCTSISSAVAASCNLITIIPNIYRYFHGTSSSASAPETKAGTRWCRRKLPRSFDGAVCSDTKKGKPRSTKNTDVVFRIRFKYGLGADEATMPISKVCLPSKTTRTPAG